MNKTLINVALAVVFGSAALSAQAANTFTFTNGTSANGAGTGAANVSWFSMLAADTDSDGIPDANVYTGLRGTNTTLTTGSWHFDTASAQPVTGGGGAAHNVGNDLTRDWSFFSAWGSDYSKFAQAVTYTGGTTATVNMFGETVHWNGGDIDMGQGAAGVLSAGADGVWGTGDERFDYAAVVPSGSFKGVAWAMHLAGTMATPTNTAVAAVPVPAAAWLLGSGLLGLVGVARRKAA